jgi:hypothetical protein
MSKGKASTKTKRASAKGKAKRLTKRGSAPSSKTITSAYTYTLLRLPWLAPDITTAIVNARQPLQLSAKFLMLSVAVAY